MNTIHSFRTDKQVNGQATAILRSLCTDLPQLFNMRIKQIGFPKGVPFDIDPGYNQETSDILDEVIQRKNLNGSYETLEEMKKALHA